MALSSHSIERESRSAKTLPHHATGFLGGGRDGERRSGAHRLIAASSWSPRRTLEHRSVLRGSGRSWPHLSGQSRPAITQVPWTTRRRHPGVEGLRRWPVTRSDGSLRVAGRRTPTASAQTSDRPSAVHDAELATRPMAASTRFMAAANFLDGSRAPPHRSQAQPSSLHPWLLRDRPEAPRARTGTPVQRRRRPAPRVSHRA